MTVLHFFITCRTRSLKVSLGNSKFVKLFSTYHISSGKIAYCLAHDILLIPPKFLLDSLIKLIDLSSYSRNIKIMLNKFKRCVGENTNKHAHEIIFSKPLNSFFFGLLWIKFYKIRSRVTMICKFLCILSGWANKLIRRNKNPNKK